MITEIGKFLRVLRISNDEAAKDMAEKLKVSASYLSAVELGKRQIPASWEDIIIKKYNLNESDKEKLKLAIKNSTPTKTTINLTYTDEQQKELIMKVAEGKLNKETIEKLCEIIKLDGKEGK